MSVTPSDIFVNKTDEQEPLFSHNLLFKTIMNHSIDSIYFKDQNLRFIYVNKNKATRHGISDPVEMVGKTDFDYISENSAREIAVIERKILKEGKTVTGTIEKLTRIDGSTTWASSSKYPLYDSSGKIIGIWGISRDITEYEETKKALNSSESRHKALIANISDIIIITNAEGIIQYVSPNSQKEFHWIPNDLIGTSFLALVHATDRNKIRTEMNALTQGKRSLKTCELRYRCANKRYKHIEITMKNCIDDPNIKGILMNYRDISERKRKEKQILYLSHHDILTGLYNRTYFDDALKYFDSPRHLPLSFMIGDINGLKTINDSFGHAQGDKLLIKTAEILKEHCRRKDILARFSGDEFYLLMPRTHTKTVKTIFDRILQSCKKDHHAVNFDNHVTFPSISLGFATKFHPDESLEQLMQQAETQMYHRKYTEWSNQCRPH